MNVEAFIPDWPGPKQHAKELRNIVDGYCPTTILDDPADYFNAQWRKASNVLNADILLWIMADVTLPEKFGTVFREMVRIMNRGDIGWYAPDIAWTCYIYDEKDLQAIEPRIYNVPNTDSLCFAIRADVVRKMPFIDPAISYMWGMDFAAIATARLMGLKTVRDYRFKAAHPNSTGYDIPKASREMEKLAQGYSTELRTEIKRLVVEVEQLKRKP